MEELERKCMICGHVFTLESRGRKKKTCPACRERILQEHDKYEAEFNRGEKPAPDFCIVCGKQIDDPRTRKYTCSPTCRREMVNAVCNRWQRKKRKIMKIKRMQEKAREKEEKAKDDEFAKEIKKQFRKGHRPPKQKTYTPETKELSSMGQCIEEARRAGLSYGQYMARKISQGQKVERR